MQPTPDVPDHRDKHLDYDEKKGLTNPEVDLRNHFPPVYDQGRMMSCTANAVAGAFQFEVQRQGLPEFDPSRLFIWYNARAKSTTHSDATKKNVASSIRDAIQSLNFHQHGVCSEADWPYEEANYNEKTFYFEKGARARETPPVNVEKHAHSHTACEYLSLDGSNLHNRLIQCLDEHFPFVFGMKTYGLLSSGTGIVQADGSGLKLPTAEQRKNDEHRHSLIAVGYSHKKKVFIVRNSWGPNWGDKGYFLLPFGYMEKYCYDFWTIRVVKSPHA